MGEIFDSNNEIDHSNLAVKEQPTTYQVNTDKNQVLALLYTQQDILDQDNYMPLVIDIPKLDGLDYGANIFAYKLHDDSQQPRYNKNDLLIFDRHATQKPSDIVIATYDGNVIIGKYRLIGRDDFEISPLNTDYGSIKNTDADLEIEGVLIQAVIIV
jgi:phage repressor protein C with HTH and peptisase S24 domain